MTVIASLAGAFGSWEGTNGFRLMPDDEPAVAPVTASVAEEAGGHLVTFGYRWSHPVDGAQEGLIVLGHAADEQQAIGLWSDSWHQPAAQPLRGAADGEELSVEYEYAPGWRWRIVITPGSDPLVLRMVNVVPEGAAGEHPAAEYDAMVMELHRVR